MKRSILDKNDRLAERNRGFFQARGLLVLNVLSSPGSGKTTLLQETIRRLSNRLKTGVIVGDLATDNDARRLGEAGAQAVQITTGTVCHLEAEMVARAVKELDLISVGGRAAYAAMGDAGPKQVIPVEAGGSVATGYNARRIDRYDAYYLDRTKKLPLPVWLVELNDSVHSRFYVDGSTMQIVGSYSSDQWAERWLYHGLHSINFPWLYNHRPAWDIVVITLMIGGAALSITSVIIGWSFIGRKVYSVAGARNR